MTSRLTLILLLLTIWSCGESEQVEVATDPEPSLHEQIVAVQAGRSELIRLEEAEIGTEDLERLSTLDGLKHLHVLRLP